MVHFLIPQISKKGRERMFSLMNNGEEFTSAQNHLGLSDYNYFTIIDGKATVINNPVNHRTNYRFGKVRITKDLGNIQFGVVTEWVETLPISKEELVEFFGKTDGIYLSSYHAQFTDTFYSKAEYMNTLVSRVSVPGNSFTMAFYKTKYGIEYSSYSSFIGSFKATTAYWMQNIQPTVEISFKDWHQPATITEFRKTEEGIKFYEVTGWRDSIIWKTKKDFFEIISEKEVLIEIPINGIEITGKLFYGGFTAFCVVGTGLNTTCGDSHRCFIRNHPEVEFTPPTTDMQWDSIEFTGIMFEANGFYIIDVTTVGELKYCKRTYGYSSYGDTENRRNGIDS